VDVVLVGSGLHLSGVEESLRPETEALRAVLQRGVLQKAIQLVPHFLVVDRAFYAAEVAPFVARALVEKFLANEHADLQKNAEAAKAYISDAQGAAAKVSRLGDDLVKYLNLAKDWVWLYLPWLLSKTNRVSYGPPTCR
jgi:hypothetical protein